MELHHPVFIFRFWTMGTSDWTIFGATDATVVGHLRPERLAARRHLSIIEVRFRCTGNVTSWQVLRRSARDSKTRWDPGPWPRYFFGARWMRLRFGRALSEAGARGDLPAGAWCFGAEMRRNRDFATRDYGASGPAQGFRGARARPMANRSWITPARATVRRQVQEGNDQ